MNLTPQTEYELQRFVERLPQQDRDALLQRVAQREVLLLGGVIAVLAALVL